METSGVLGRDGAALQFVVPVHLLLRSVGNEERREELPEGRYVLAPSGPDETDHGGAALLLLGRPVEAPALVASSIEDEM